MKFIASIILSVIISVGSFVYYDKTVHQDELGTSITTINGSDTLKDSRTTINDNFTALNAGKIENATTSLPFLTSLQRLATVGTITSGTWNGSAIGVGYGGTGTTSPTLNMVILGDASSGFKVVSGYGVSGQFLTSGGNGNPPTWTTSSIDQSLAYTWSGVHKFSSGLYASSTLQSSLGLKVYDTVGSSTLPNISVDQIGGNTTSTTTITGNLLVSGDIGIVGKNNNGIKWEYISSDTDVSGDYSFTPPAGAKVAIITTTINNTTFDSPCTFSVFKTGQTSGGCSGTDIGNSNDAASLSGSWSGDTLSGTCAVSNSGTCNNTTAYYYK